MAQHNLLGKKGEMLAARYLLGEGLAILEYNWRNKHKEIDLIAKERDTIVFIEVKTRSHEKFGKIQEAITIQKIRNITLAAEAYINIHKIDLPIRFDIVTIIQNGESHNIEHIRNAFYPDIESL